MEPSEIRALDADEMEKQFSDLVESYFNLRFQHRTGQLENPKRLSQVRRDIARIKTIKREKELKLG